jgi:hypothetical protein
VAKQRDGSLRSWMVNYAEGCVAKQRVGWLRSWMVNYAEGCVAKQRDGWLSSWMVCYAEGWIPVASYRGWVVKLVARLLVRASSLGSNPDIF